MPPAYGTVDQKTVEAHLIPGREQIEKLARRVAAALPHSHEHATQETTARAAQELGVTQSRVSDLVRGRHEKFSIDMLVALAARAGRTVKLRLAA